MYVKWQRRSRKRGGDYPLLTAVLVESRRVDGKPRQNHVAYLASIRERSIGEPGRAHDGFWASVEANLDALELDNETRMKIEASIAERVPRMTAETRAAFEAVEASLASANAADAADYRRLTGARY